MEEWWKRKSSEVKIGLLLLLTLVGPLFAASSFEYGLFGILLWFGACSAILYYVGKVRTEAEQEGEDRALGRPTPFRDRRDFSD